MQALHDPHATTASRRTAECAEAVLSRVDFSANPYLRGLREGNLTLEAFRASQEQFFYAVDFFARPLAALVAKIPVPGKRLDLIRNLLEEHGGLQPAKFHANTFRAFLGTLGCEPGRLDDLVLWPEVRAFNSVLLTACVHDELEVGVACVGIVEHAFARISAAIGRGVVERGWVREADLTHYALHAEIDERHAEELYSVVESEWADPKRRYYIEQGLELGAYVFDRLYRDLWERAQRVEPRAGSVRS